MDLFEKDYIFIPINFKYDPLTKLFAFVISSVYWGADT